MQEFLDNYELKITNYELFSCICQKKAVILQGKKNGGLMNDGLMNDGLMK
ncbi:MAG: hypothetical protein IKO26_04090 [Paludibacteraceae bacterium]|nr:hypothetical protein [Paludibacteraceae bacterium]